MFSLRPRYSAFRRNVIAENPRLHRLEQDVATLRRVLSGGIPPDPDLHWLFIYTFPNGGSTAFSDLLGSSTRACRLKPNSEGQWLIPELADLERRSMDAPLVSRQKLRHVWMSRARSAGPEGPRVVIEKSPDNVFRWQHLQDSFSDMPQTSIVFVREPLPTIASWMKRYDWQKSGARWAPLLGMPAATRQDGLRILARLYLRRAERLMACREKADLFLSYEKLCEDPAFWVSRIAEREPLLADVDVTSHLSVKDYEAQGLRNLNAANMALLSPEDTDILLDELAKDPGLLSEMGYSLAAMLPAAEEAPGPRREDANV